MSEDRFEKDEPKDEDVEAHRNEAGRKALQGTDETGADTSDDVEAHRKHAMNEEPGSDESDDVEAHRKHV